MASTYRGLLHACAVIAALLLGVTALAVTGDVVARNLGLGTLPWILEVSEYVLPLATFLVAPWLLARNEHVRLDVLLTALPSRLARALEGAGNLLGLAVCAVFVIYGARARRGGRAVSKTSSRTCSLRASSHGATRNVASGRTYSETSSIQGSVPSPRLRATTSPVTSSAVTPSSSAAITAQACSSPR